MRRTIQAAFAALALASATVITPAFVLPAIAQSQPDISEQTVVNFIASYPEVMAIAQKLEEENNLPSDTGDDPAAAMGALMAYQGAMDRLNGAVTAHGFAGYMDWVQAMSAIATAFAFARDGGAMDEMQSAIDEINANTSLSAEQKTMMLEQIKAASAAMDAMRPSQATLGAVKAHEAELAALFDS